MSMKAEIAKGKKLDKDMIAYMVDTKRNLGTSFAEALRQMKIQASRVAADLGVSQAFVEAWTTKELENEG